MARPLIAVAGFRIPPEIIQGWRIGAYGVPETYIAALSRAGGVPAVLAPGEAPDVGDLHRFDGLLLAGGGDVHPKRYGAPDVHPSCYGLDPVRDAFEIGLLHAAVRIGLPTLAVCRGAQVLNVAFGGTLIQNIPDLPGTAVHWQGQEDSAWHRVDVLDSTRLGRACRQTSLTVASRHHQGIDRPGEGLVPVAWSEDGLIEALEREDGWMIGIQWHPEASAERDQSQQALFDALVDRALGRRASTLTAG